MTSAASAAEIRVGPARVTAVLDAEGVFPGSLAEVFPDAGPGLLDRAEVLDPRLTVAPGSWWLAFRTYVVEAAGRVVLVDTGAASDTSLRPAWAPGPDGHLVHRLADQAGVAAGDVTDVVLTHLHADHAAGSVGADGHPAFPNARYLLQRAEIAALPGESVLGSGLVAPLRDTGQLVVCDGELELVTAGGASVRVLPSPGHTAGHQSVVVTAGREAVALAGDAFVHAAQVLDPELRYVHEDDPAAAARTRAGLLDLLAERRGRLGTAHLGTPYLTPPSLTPPS